MYAYCRFWNAEKALLLYPGVNTESQFQSFLTADYSKNKEDQINAIDHQCKMGFVSVLDGEKLSELIGEDVLWELGCDYLGI